MRPPRSRAGLPVALLATALLSGTPAIGQAPEGPDDSPASEAPPKPAPRPRPRPAPKPAPKPGPAPEGAPAAKTPAPEPAPALPIEAYARAAATTIIAEQSCPGVRLNAGQLTNLRLSARVAPGQEGILEQTLRALSVEVRRNLAADGREAWCAAALGAFGPAGTVARGVLTQAP